MAGIVEKTMQKVAKSGGRVSPASTASAAASSGALDTITLDKSVFQEFGHIADRAAAAKLAEEMRLIKRPILQNAFSDTRSVENGNLLMVASALPGAGKTFITFNLALSIATELDCSVTLVDADVSKPHLTHRFGLQDRQGLTNLLTDDLALSDVLLTTDVKGLTILPAGTRAEHATELLASDRMRRLIRNLGTRERGQIVVFDSPPLLMTSQAKALADVVGQIVVVVAANSTPQQAVIQAIQDLDPSKAINVILNKAVRSAVPGLSGDEYGYGHAYGQESTGA